MRNLIRLVLKELMVIVFENGGLKLNLEEFILFGCENKIIYKKNYSIMELVLFVG